MASGTVDPASRTGSVNSMPAEPTGRSRPARAGIPISGLLAKARPGADTVPLLFFSAGLGLLLCSVANTLSRAALAPSPLIYWAGILIIALPIFHRLSSEEASTRERLGLVCLLGLALYSVKVIHDAPLFTFSDELVHAFNANQIASHHHLFHANPLLPVTPYYPGLEGATSALASITGLSSYGAGIVLVGAARLVLMGSLFLLFARVGGSARTAGLAAALYTANFNFLFWGAQFSYESLALPLLLLTMMAFAEREVTPKASLKAWTAPIVLAIAAVSITHHLTSYALAGALVAISLAYWYVHRRWRSPNPWPFALVTLAVAAVWLLVVAGSTVGYLSPVLSGAVKAIVNTATGESPPRALFHNSSGATIEATPVSARAISFLAVALLTAGLPFGLWRVWKRYRSQPFALVFGVAAVGFFGTLALRLTPPAWETGNRASEFLFVGLAFVLATTGLETWRPRAGPWLGRALLTGCLGVLLVGGALSGWPWDAQLSQPLRISAEGKTIVSPPLGLAEWAREEVPGGRFAAPSADARLLLVPGGDIAMSGESPDIEDILSEGALANWELPLLREHQLRYVVTDGRALSEDVLRGYFFSTKESVAQEEPPQKDAVTKFSHIPGATRIYTNGDIAVFDLEGKR